MKNNRKVKPGQLERRENAIGYLFILPWLIGIIVLVLWPMVQSFGYSLNKIRLLPQGMAKLYVGFENYSQIFLKDPDFIMGLESYLLETLIAVPVIVAFSLIIAMLLNQKISCRGIFRMIFFLPIIIASGPVMQQLADQEAASIPMMNVTMIEQLLDEYLPHVLAVSITSVFSNMITLLWYSKWECFWKITLPTVKPMILLNVVYTVIFMSNNEQNALIVLIYDTMLSATGGYGYASAMAWLYSVIESAIVIFFAVLIMGRKDVYERRAKKYQRELKREKRLEKKIRKRGERNERNYAKQKEKRERKQSKKSA